MPIDSVEKRPYYVLIETNNALEGKTMNAIQIIEAAFLAHKASGNGNSISLNKTVDQFKGVYNPFLVSTHLRHCALWA